MKLLSTNLILVLVLFLVACDSADPVNPPVRQSYKHVRATWSPDGVSVAFTAEVGSSFGIYAVDTSGANFRLLHAGDALGLSWSPDGQYIAYSQQSQIYQVPVSIDNPQLIVPQAPSIRPAWSPDGSRLAYVRDGLRMVYVATGQDTEVYASGTSPSWRPMGTSLLAHIPRIDGVTGEYRYDVFVVDVDSSTRSDILSLATVDDCGFFSMSPDGQSVVFSRKPPGSLAQIRRISVSTQAEIGLTTDGGDYPAISPDGEWIVYTRTAEGDGGLWLMRMDGSEKRRLTAP